MLSKTVLEEFCEVVIRYGIKTLKVSKEGFELETWSAPEKKAEPKDEKADKLIESLNSITDAELLENPYAGLDVAFKEEASSN
jgi:hypothetical protein